MTDLTRANGHGTDEDQDWLMGDGKPARPKGPYARGAEVYADLGWTGMIPLDRKTKTVILKNVTGGEGRQLRPDQYNRPTIVSTYGKCNIGYRTPVGVAGLDVDQYDEKTGADTLAALEGQLGPLPATWSSTSRGADSQSRIRFFTIPEDTGKLAPFAGRDIDVIQHHHRYAAVWPSVHPTTDAEYRWYRPTGELCATAPGPDDFAPLPDAWLEYLKKAERNDVPGAGLTVGDFVDECKGNDEPEIAQFIRQAFSDQPGGRHDSMMISLGWAARAAADWKIPAGEIFELLEYDWTEALDGDPRDWEKEFRKLLERAVRDAPEPRNPENAGAVAFMMNKILDREGLRRIKAPEYLIKGWLTEGMGNRINGDPGSGKSLVALDWAACIGAGVPWQGCDTRQGTVLYVVAEGVEGFASKRVPAWEMHNGRELAGVLVYPEPVQVVERQGGELRASKEWQTFRAVCRQLKPDLVVFDTQRRVMRDVQENDNTDLGKAVDCLEELRRDFRMAWLLVHHTPKNGSGGVGGGAVWGAINSEFEMIKKGRGLEGSKFWLESTKEKDDEDGARMEFRLQRYDVTPEDGDRDPFDDPVTSVVLVPVEDDDEAEQIEEVDLSVPEGTSARDAVAILLRRVWQDQVFTKSQGWSTLRDSGVMTRQTYYKNFGPLKDEGVIVAERGQQGQELQRYTVLEGF